MKRADALHSRAALILRNAEIVNHQRSVSTSPGKENRRSGRVRVASRHLFGDDFIWTSTLEQRDHGQHSSTTVEDGFQPLSISVTEFCQQKPPSSGPAGSTDHGQPTVELTHLGENSSTIVQSVFQSSPSRVTEFSQQEPLLPSMPAVSTDQGQPAVELKDLGEHSSTNVQSVFQPSPSRVTDFCQQEPTSAVPTDQGQPAVELTDLGQHSPTVVQNTRNGYTEYGQQSAATIQVTDSTADQISMFTFSDMSLSLTDFQGSFVFSELSPACLERNLTSTPLPLKRPDAANNGITETAVNSSAVQDSPICIALSQVPVTSELQQAGPMLGPFSVLLQAANVLWQDPAQSSAQPSLSDVAAGASNQQHMQSVVQTATMQQTPANHQTPAKNGAKSTCTTDETQICESARNINSSKRRKTGPNNGEKSNSTSCQSAVQRGLPQQVRQQRTKNSETPAVSSVQSKPNTRQRSKRKNTQASAVTIRDIPSGSEDSALSSSEEGDEHQKLTSTREVLRSSSHQQPSDGQSRNDLNQNNQKFRNKWQTAILKKTPESLHFSGSFHPVDETLVYPIDYFRHYFTNELISEIASQSTLYAVQVKPEKPTKISTVDIERFMGICLYTSLVRLNYMRNYWSTEFRIAQVADTLTLNRFEDVKRFLHFSDNSVEGADKIKKIRPLVEELRQRYRTVAMEEHLSVDEQIVPFKGRSCLRQFNPKKPHKWGYKFWVLCGANGYAFDFEVYTGKCDNVLVDGEEDCGASGNVVIRLARSIPQNLNHKLFYDNFFTSPALQVFLAKKGIHSVGTVRANRLPSCSLKSEAEMKKGGRGTIDERTVTADGIQISAVRWHDNKTVTLLSTYAGSEPVTEVTRWNGRKKTYEKVQCPNVVTMYNKHMGGVDLIDSLIGLYRIKIRSKKWYHRLFFHLLDMTVINAWLLYRRQLAVTSSGPGQSKPLSLHQFKTRIAVALCASKQPPKRGRPSAETGPARIKDHMVERKRQYPEDDASENNNPPKKKRPNVPLPCPELRYDGLHHYPKWTDRRQRCKRETCTGLSRVMCVKCGVHLCFFAKQDCFGPYHSA